jgi:hypothetical protein
MTSRPKVIFVVVCGILAGSAFFVQALDWFVTRNAPVVTGHVISREPTRWLSIPRVDFTIKIDGSEVLVHARTQRGMMPNVPETVRFHYTGDPKRNIILFEQEMHPGWLVLLFWGAALLLVLSMRSTYVCEIMGWTSRNADEHQLAR